jgi:plasmid stabilization system protein ParE
LASAPDNVVLEGQLQCKKPLPFFRIGPPHSQVRRKDLREIVVGNYRLIYRLEDQEISILTVLHFKQILPNEKVNEQEAVTWE